MAVGLRVGALTERIIRLLTAVDLIERLGDKPEPEQKLLRRVGDVQAPFRLTCTLSDDAAHHVGADPRCFLPGSLLVGKFQAFGIVAGMPVLLDVKEILGHAEIVARGGEAVGPLMDVTVMSDTGLRRSLQVSGPGGTDVTASFGTG